MHVRRSRKRAGDVVFNASQDDQGSFKPFKIPRRGEALKPVDLAVWERPNTGQSPRHERIFQLLKQHQEQQQLRQLQQQQLQQQQQVQQLLQEQLLLQQQQQPLTGFAYSMKELADCPPPVPEGLPFSPPHIMETDDPMPHQDPPTGHPTPANSGDVDGMDAASYDSAGRAPQQGIGHMGSHMDGIINSVPFGGHDRWLGAIGVGSFGSGLDQRPALLATALPVSQQYQPQPAWQLPQQLQQQQKHEQAAKSADAGTSTGEDDWKSSHSQSCHNGSPRPSQDSPTGYATPCANSEDGPAESAPQADSGGPLVKAHSKAGQLYGGRLLGARLQALLDEVPQASADISGEGCRMQHHVSCCTPAPSQDPPSEHYSGVEDEGCGHDVTAPPSPAHSDPAALAGVPAQADSSGGYGLFLGRKASSSPVPSQDAPSEYPEPQSPASSAEEGQAECSEEMSEVSSEPLPPGVDIVETHVATLLAGQLSTEVSHASFHQPADVHLLENDGGIGYLVYYQNHMQSGYHWYELEDEIPVDSEMDDYDSGESSVGSPRRY